MRLRPATFQRPRTARVCSTKQHGVILLEALIAILIFAIGVLGIIALQATTIQQVGEAKYRTDAANLTEQLIGQMWADDHTTATLQGKYASGNGSTYLLWKTAVESRLPGAAKKAPQVTIVADASDSTKSTVTILVYWQPPGSNQMHNYTTITQIR